MSHTGSTVECGSCRSDQTFYVLVSLRGDGRRYLKQWDKCRGKRPVVQPACQSDAYAGKLIWNVARAFDDRMKRWTCRSLDGRLVRKVNQLHRVNYLHVGSNRSTHLAFPNSVAPMDAQQSRRRIPNIQFRVLIIGRANAGKTSILQRVCDTTESPIIYRGEEEVCDPTFSSANLISLSTRSNWTHPLMLVIIVLLFGCP